MAKILHNQRGVSLIELIVVLVILFVISFAFGKFQKDIFSNNDEYQRRLYAEQEARTSLKNLIAELRSAQQSDVGDYPIILASSSAITFFGDIDGDGLQERVRYYLDGRTLRKTVLKPTGSPHTYVEANEIKSYEINDVITTGGQIFTYYDRNYTGTSSALSFPVNVSNIRLVKVTITVDANPTRAPEPITFTSQVMIRNLKDNL
jgi:prepilin-type N-terminal cleavage/methylation domain-containing protein